jgi:hypothetical protein
LVAVVQQQRSAGQLAYRPTQLVAAAAAQHTSLTAIRSEQGSSSAFLRAQGYAKLGATTVTFAQAPPQTLVTRAAAGPEATAASTREVDDALPRHSV